ncbi:MAG: lactate utilization protein [Aggregatilineales bacterium]
MGSREQILGKLRAARKPFEDVPPITERKHMVKLADLSPETLRARFIDEAEKLSCYVCEAKSDQEALDYILAVLEDRKQVMSWDAKHIPIEGYQDALDKNEILVSGYNDPMVYVGVTGVDAALAATGSLVLCAGAGKHRATSLLPDIHIAVVKSDQLLPDLEAWIAQEKQTGTPAFKITSNTTIVSGPSKTADIGQELIKGAHGPRQVHIILL